jgi:hypothetical protein
MHSPDTTSPPAGALLAQAESHTRLGRYDDALRVLGSTGYGANGEHSDYWMGMVCAAAARNKLHAQDDQGVLQLLNLISAELRAANPKIDTECHTIVGILRRRDAHRHWKMGQTEAALLKVQQAIDAFEVARHSAQMGLEDRLQHNAVLNRLYATGLQFAIQAQPRERYATLLADAIVTEAASRDSTPPHVRDDLTGLTIIVDLACGGGISLRSTSSLSNAPIFQAAVRKIICYDSASWADLILNYVRDLGICKTDVVVRALLLGCKMLYADDHAADHGMQTEYAARLRIHYLDLESASSNTSLLQSIAQALSRFPPEIARKVMHPKFLR